MDDLIILGVRLIEAIGKNHCFEQGNKRTAFHSGLVFMQRNEIYFDLGDTQDLAELVTAVITGGSQPSALVDLLRERQW